ncbi:hypothetical protein [Nocardia sp. IFM 10818]
MAWRTRLFDFPGGILETNAYGDKSDDDPGVYLELFQPESDSRDDDHSQGADMRYKATILGYLRTDVSGISQLWDESQLRKRAAQLGYDFAAMIVYDPKFGRPPLARLRAQATRLNAEAVIVPSPGHFEGGEVPGSLVQQLDVITVSPEETYARRETPPLRDMPSIRRADGA